MMCQEQNQCCNCKRTTKHNLRRGRCPSCYRYHRVHGVEMPLHKLRPRINRGQKPICSNCRQRFVACFDLCQPCYEYQRIHPGRKRPAHLWQEKCRNCERPRGSTSATRLRRGLCHACHQYKRRYGHNRPAESIKRQAPYGWCDCCEPAVTVEELTVGATVERIPLCARCYQLEHSYQPGNDATQAGTFDARRMDYHT